MMSSNELGLIIALIILLMISFFMLGYMYARLKIARIISRFRPPRHVEVKEIKIKDDDFQEFMQSIINKIEDEEENEENDENGRNSENT